MDVQEKLDLGQKENIASNTLDGMRINLLKSLFGKLDFDGLIGKIQLK